MMRSTALTPLGQRKPQVEQVVQSHSSSRPTSSNGWPHSIWYTSALGLSALLGEMGQPPGRVPHCIQDARPNCSTRARVSNIEFLPSSIDNECVIASSDCHGLGRGLGLVGR